MTYQAKTYCKTFYFFRKRIKNLEYTSGDIRFIFNNDRDLLFFHPFSRSADMSKGISTFNNEYMEYYLEIYNE